MKFLQLVLLKSLFAFVCFSASLQAYVYTVTSLDDSGTGTLRDLMNSLVDGDGIDFDVSLSGTILLESALPEIAVSYTTITGPLDNSISIDGDDLYRIFEITGNHTTITNLNLLKGTDPSQGGIIHIASNKYLVLTDVNITPSSTEDGINPIYLELDATVTAQDVVFVSENTSDFFLNGALFVTNNIDLQYTIDAFGGVVLVKDGLGTLTLLTPESTVPDVQIELWEGLLDFNGTIAQGVYLFPDGNCQGTFDVAYVVNSGSLQPGNSTTFGTMSLSPYEYIQIADNGNTIIKLDASGNNDLIHTDNLGYILGGTLTLVPASGTYTENTTYTIFTGTMGLTGAFDSIDAGGLDVQVNFNEFSIDVVILTTTTI